MFPSCSRRGGSACASSPSLRHVCHPQYSIVQCKLLQLTHSSCCQSSPDQPIYLPDCCTLCTLCIISGVGVIILAGEGPLAFCSGGDQRVSGREGSPDCSAIGLATRDEHASLSLSQGVTPCCCCVMRMLKSRAEVDLVLGSLEGKVSILEGSFQPRELGVGYFVGKSTRHVLCCRPTLASSLQGGATAHILLQATCRIPLCSPLGGGRSWHVLCKNAHPGGESIKMEDLLFFDHDLGGKVPLGDIFLIFQPPRHL